MKKTAKKLVACVLTVICIMAYVQVPAFAATSAKFGSSSYCQVTISNKLIQKRGKQYAKVKINTYSMVGRFNNGAKVQVTMRDERNRVIWSGVKKGGDTLKLGDDHRVYRISLKPYEQPVKGNMFQRSIISGNNFTNGGKCYKWSFCNAKDCTIR